MREHILKWPGYCHRESRIGSSFSCQDMETRARNLGWVISAEDATYPETWVHLVGTGSMAGVVECWFLEWLWESGVNCIAILEGGRVQDWGPWSRGDVHHGISVLRTLHITEGAPGLPDLKRKQNAPLLIHLIIEHGFIPSAFDNNGRCQNEWCRGGYWKSAM